MSGAERRCCTILGWSVLVWLASISDSTGRPVYDTNKYPELKQRIDQFDSRVNSPDNMVRYKLMGEVSGLLSSQDSNNGFFKESTGLLQDMWSDDFPLLVDQSVQRFVADGVLINKKLLPQQLWKVNVRDKKAVDGFLDKERPTVIHPSDKTPMPIRKEANVSYTQTSRGAEIGWAAEKIGVLGSETDIPYLKSHFDHPNPYVRFSVANAVRNLGHDNEGKSVLIGLANGNEHYYARKAAQILAREGVPLGKKRLNALDESKEQHHER